ncbi:MAG: LAGLIDADG family homing endonuclease [Candidatus Hadarchaeota archaeon]|nr:LAGLIDADG family homing endonuclease [Candidatus Hadarchaeota archaeon]
MKDKVAALLDSCDIEHRIEHDEFVLRRSKLRICLPPVDEELAYLLGFLCGDGCLKKPQPRKMGGARFKITLCFSGSERGKMHAQCICEIFKKYFHYVPRMYNKGRKGRKDWLEVEINSVVTYAYFYQLGLPVGRKYGKLRVPSVVFTKTLFREFLRGLIDSDGHIAEDRRIVIVQKDMNFLVQVRELCLRLFNAKFSIPRPNSKKIGNRTYTWYYIQTFETNQLGEFFNINATR